MFCIENGKYNIYTYFAETRHILVYEQLTVQNVF